MPEPDQHDAPRRQSPCPASPNCVSSDAEGERHRVEPLRLAASPRVAWTAAVAAVRALPRSEIVTLHEDYLHARIESAVFRFADDLELQLRPEQNLIAIRSAARTGHYDFGVNRRRVEGLRRTLRRRGVVQRAE